MKHLLIVNPASGVVSKHKLVPLICHLLREKGIDYDIVFTKAPGHGHELAREASAKGYGAVIACGGDGTVNEIASGLTGTDTVLGIIPTGSGNGLARHVGIPIDLARSISIIAAGNTVKADYGMANGNPFFCTFGVGFDAAVSERCAREKRRGILMYLRNVINEYIKFRPEEYTIEVDGKVITERAFLVVCCNASQYGNNAFIAPTASITDGELDVTIVHTGNLIAQAIAGLDILTGLIRRNAFVDVFRASSLKIKRKSEGSGHVDGDAVKLPEEIEVVCCPAALNLFAPTKSTSFRPIITPVTLFFRDLGLAIRHLLPGERQ
ncbi:MAG: diacylglycerol kinase family lipid kinase [Bacteroidales bacterium]|nr:diacylglycerol kinase family lipid kinase [Bacteroidales bacterium]